MGNKQMQLGLYLVALTLLLVSQSGFAADRKTAVKPGASATETVDRSAGKDVAGKGDLIDINTATREALKALKGVDEDTARKIIDGRPYAKKDQLRSRKIISHTIYDRIKDRIIAKQPPGKK